MTDGHSDIAADLWALADTVLTRLEPILRQAAESAQDKDRQGCSWCPVCAVAALLRGEQHDLLTLVATEGAGVIALIRQLLAEHGTGPAHPPAAAQPSDSSGTGTPSGDSAVESDVLHDTSGPVGRPTSFVPITVTIKESQSDRGAGE